MDGADHICQGCCRGTAAAHKTHQLKSRKDAATASSDCEALLVTVTLPAGVAYEPGTTKAGGYSATVTDGVLTWRGPAPARVKTQKLQARLTVSASAPTGPIYLTAGVQCLTSAGVPSCTMPTTTAVVRRRMEWRTASGLGFVLWS